MQIETLKKKRIGFAITGSFCTLDVAIQAMKELTDLGADIFPIISFNIDNLDTKFGTADGLKAEIAKITPNPIIRTLTQAEPIGPGRMLDALLVLPATGNTIAKLAMGLADTPVTMAAKSHLRNGGPVILAISSNDALGLGAKNIGLLLAVKNIYFVPFGQDNAQVKPRSIVFIKEHVSTAVAEALEGRQMQPILG